jgi:hypothetical protein
MSTPVISCMPAYMLRPSYPSSGRYLLGVQQMSHWVKFFAVVLRRKLIFILCAGPPFLIHIIFAYGEVIRRILLFFCCLPLVSSPVFSSAFTAFAIRNFAIRNFAIRNFAIRNFAIALTSLFALICYSLIRYCLCLLCFPLASAAASKQNQDKQ